MLEEGETTVRILKKICGNLIDIRCLIPGARFHLSQLLMESSVVAEGIELERIVEVSEWFREDLYFFSLALPVYSHRTKIMDPDRKPDSWAVKSHTDAAGGSVDNKGRGVGMVILPKVWTYVPWSR